MLRLILIAAAAVPCMLLPFVSSSQASISERDVTFDKTYADPALSALNQCENASLEVYFHDEFITMHSAEYLADSLAVSDKCGPAEFKIYPVKRQSMSPSETALLEKQTQELVAILAAYDVDANVNETAQVFEYDTLSLNGRSAIVTITVSDGRAS